MIYDKTTPAGTGITIQTRISTDNGNTWGPWEKKASGDLVIECGVNKGSYRMQWRAILTSYSNGVTASLNNVEISSTYAKNGSWISPIYDLGNTTSANNLMFTVTTPANTTVTAYARGSSSGSVFGDWQEVLVCGNAIPLQRYIQVMFVLTTTDITASPTVSDFLISCP